MDHRFGESGGKVKTEKVGSNDLNPLFSGKSLAQAVSQDGIHFDQIEPSRYLSQGMRKCWPSCLCGLIPSSPRAKRACCKRVGTTYRGRTAEAFNSREARCP